MMIFMEFKTDKKMKNNIPFWTFVWAYRKLFMLGYNAVVIFCIIVSLFTQFYLSGLMVSLCFFLIVWAAMVYEWREFQRIVGKRQLNTEHKHYGLQD